MKKIFTILCLMALTLGAQAQAISSWTAELTPVTKDALVASAGSGERYVFRMPSFSAPGWCNFVNRPAYTNTKQPLTNTTYYYSVTDDYLFTIESGSTAGKYKLKRYTDGKFLSGNAQFNDTGMDLTLTNRTPTGVNDFDDGMGYSTNYVSFDNASGGHYNCGNDQNGGLQFRGGTGGWSVYAAYGPIYKNITIDCKEGNVSMSGYPLQSDYRIGGTFEAPVFHGKKLVDGEPTSVTIDQDNMSFTFKYEASTFDYTLVVNGAPDGTTITIKGEPASAGAVSFDSEVTESDVNVTLPQTYYTYAVVINGTTITINIEDTRWPVNFDKSTKSTNEKRYTDMVGIDNSRVTWESQAKDFIYRDMTSQTITVAAGRTVTPYIGFRGWAMYGYLYIDYNNDGDFTDDGELVSQMTGNTWQSEDTGDKTIPAFTITSTPGTYRARFKVEWNNTDPGGHVPAMDEHGGSITDVMVEVVEMIEINYNYKFNGVLVKTESVAAQIGKPFPALSNPPYGFSGTAPEGNVTAEDAGTTKDIALTWTLFDYADSYNNISKWYNVRMNSKQTYYLYNNNGAVAFNGSVGTNDYLWGFVGDPIEGFQMYSLTAGDGVALDNADPCTLSADGKSVKFKVASGSKGSQTWSDSYFALYVTEGNYLNYQNGAIKRWNVNDAGSTIMVKEAQPDINEYITKLDAMVWGQDLNQYHLTGELAGDAGNEAALIAMVKSDGNINERIGRALKILANAELNMPKANTFLRIKSAATEKYISSTVDGSQSGKYATYYLGVENADNTTIWFYDGTHLLNYATGLYTNNCSAAAIGGENKTAIAFSEAINGIGKYNIKPGSENYWYAGNPTIDNSGDGSNVANHFTLEEVPTLPVKMNVVGDKSYATFYSPVAISKVDGAKVYVVEQTKSNSVVIEEATTQAIPAGKGVMLVSDEQNTSATLTIGEAGDFNTSLDGVTASEQITKDTDPYNSKLFLSKKDGKIGFYKIKTADNVGVTGGFKAYLSTAAGAKEGFELEFGGVTGIENMEHGTLNMENGAVYNLQGQRVNKAQKGVFIQNGKKVVVR